MENIGEDKVVDCLVLHIHIHSLKCSFFDNSYPNVHFERNLIRRNPFCYDYPYVYQYTVMFNVGSNLLDTKLTQIGSGLDLKPSAACLIKLIFSYRPHTTNIL